MPSHTPMPQNTDFKAEDLSAGEHAAQNVQRRLVLPRAELGNEHSAVGNIV